MGRGECNRCTYNRLKHNTPGDHRFFTSARINPDGGFSGANVYRVPKSINESEFKTMSEADRTGYFVAWFMELPDHCVC
jgi:hypothetical protein